MQEAHKRRILVALIAVTSLPAVLFTTAPSSTATLSSWELYLSATIGYIGIVLLLWMYILGNKSVVGLFFRDLAPLLKIHSWLGKYGLVLIFLHPLFVTLSYSQSLLYMAIPHIDSSFERHVTLGRLSLLILLIIWITSAVIRGKIKYRPWKYIHFLSYIALPFALLHTPLIGTQIMTHPALKAYYFSLVVAFIAFSFIRLASLFNLDKSRYRLVQNEQIGKNSYLVTFHPINERIRPPKPGQYVYVKLGFVSEDHPFSVVSYDKQSGDITLAYRAYGQFTQLMSELPISAEIFLGGSFGSFTNNFYDDPPPVVFVAGGIGITPFMGHLFGKGADRSWLVYANRDETSSLFIPQLRRQLPGHLIEIYSDDTKHSPQYISAETFSRLGQDVRRCTFYICGPAGMIRSSQKVLASMGVPRQQVHAEEFMF